MLKTYSMDGNYNSITIEHKQGMGVVRFPIEFTGGDADMLSGVMRRSTYKTESPIEQYIIEQLAFIKSEFSDECEVRMYRTRAEKSKE